ncbi:hypothetical protein BJP36_02900 [Moorena producens JHB]|uniref:Uncharacterized protein n=1 Tax=Moorena producens (strain JHB) TaxID=1454205 RepID=A0A1D9FUF3_MOOP1|nr:hypothetical protein [Moorena producens]AOY79009.1 hypothetical protein BJP36_02900 [Moorena producens JHB]
MITQKPEKTKKFTDYSPYSRLPYKKINSFDNPPFSYYFCYGAQISRFDLLGNKIMSTNKAKIKIKDIETRPSQDIDLLKLSQEELGKVVGGWCGTIIPQQIILINFADGTWETLDSENFDQFC